MDSLTQFALGATIGVVVMRGKTPVWKSALLGGFCGTIPDLDVFFDHGDPIRNMTYHRAETHAVFYLTLLAPLVAFATSRLPKERDNFRSWLLAYWLILVTHPLLDVFTVYGTQIARPFLDQSYFIGSVFIIDPLFTVPLLLGLALTGFIKTPGRYLWAQIGLLLSCLYLLWGVGVQNHVRHLAIDTLAARNIPTEQILVTPTPFNTLLWRIVVMTPEGYAEGFYSILDTDPAITFTLYETDPALYAQWKDDWYVQRMKWFTQGYFKMHALEGEPILTDLRMGQEPYYSFNFILHRDGPPHHFRERPDVKKILEWVKRRALGNPQGLHDYLEETQMIYKD